jgi:hypothetical protein
MTEQHPITPPPELVQQWYRDSDLQFAPYYVFMAHCAAQWGADQQLAEDAKWLDHNALSGPHLRITPMGESLKEAMRPKSPSLKEQAHDAYWVLRYGHGGDINENQKWNTIRRALEQLDD